MYNQQIPIAEYEEKECQFKGEKFNVKNYVEFTKGAYMKYITFVTKHHDGYTM